MILLIVCLGRSVAVPAWGAVFVCVRQFLYAYIYMNITVTSIKKTTTITTTATTTAKPALFLEETGLFKTQLLQTLTTILLFYNAT